MGEIKSGSVGVSRVPLDLQGKPLPLPLPTDLGGLSKAEATRRAQEQLTQWNAANDVYAASRGATPVNLQARDITDVKDADPRWSAATDLDKAKRSLRARGAAEAQALAGLGDRAADFAAVKAQLGQHVQGRLALQTLLLDGRLTKQQDLQGTGDLLTHLAALATQPLPPGLDRQDLLKTFVQELEDPTKISQGDPKSEKQKGTCVATTATILAAERNPAEVARLVAGLAHRDHDGAVALSTGGELRRHPRWNDRDDGARTPATRLLQPALMEHAVAWATQGQLHYDNSNDFMSPTGDERSFEAIDKAYWKHRNAGLDNEQGNHLLEGLTGAEFRSVADVTPAERDAVWASLKQAVAAGHAVPVGIQERDGQHDIGHQVMVSAIQGGRVIITDPDGGRLRAIPEAVFRRRFTDANIPTGEPIARQ